MSAIQVGIRIVAANLRVFVSSTCNDLFQERRDIARGVLDMGHVVVLSELPDKMPVNPNLSCIANCLEAIRNHADFVVLVISGTYGSADDEGRSITLQEYLEARSRRLPVMTFVRQKVWELLPLYKRNPTGDFSPTVTDNRVFELLERIMAEHEGNWIFPFSEAGTIVETLRYQFSCLLRAQLRHMQPSRKEIFFEYVNNYSVILAADGICYRALEYCARNDTNGPIERIYAGDMSDKDFSFDEIDLKIFKLDGSPLNYAPTIDTPRYKRWDVVLDHPLMPGGTIRYYCSYISSDNHKMLTYQNRPVDHGFIQYVFPKRFVKSEIRTALRDNTGWHDSPNGVMIRDFGLVLDQISF
jgi:Domain of unknown function (DUF4062)